MTPANRFKKACRSWQGKLGLTDWTFVYKIDRRDNDHYGYVTYSWDSRLATITLVPGKDSDIEAIALHEVLHVLLADLLATVASRASDTHPDVVREEHRVIERLMAVLGGKQ